MCGAGGGGSGGALGWRRPGGAVRAAAAAAAGGRAPAAHAAPPARPVLAPARRQPRARQRPARGPRPLVALKSRGGAFALGVRRSCPVEGMTFPESTSVEAPEIRWRVNLPSPSSVHHRRRAAQRVPSIPCERHGDMP